jgi:molybdopterin converting factor small subunit
MPAITLRYHAFLRDNLNRETERVEVDGMTATVADALAAFVRKYPAYNRLAPALLFARQDEFLQRDDVLKDGDILEVLPPYGGG